MPRIRSVATCLAFFAMPLCAAQLSGSIVDLSGKPVKGATVRMQGVRDSVLSKDDGTWSLARTSGTKAKSTVLLGARHLVVGSNGRIDLDWRGHDLLGRSHSPLATTIAPAFLPTARSVAAIALTDTVMIVWKGKRLFRIPVGSGDTTGIVSRIDTAWQDDFDIPWDPNPRGCYGSLFDPRDGRTYRTSTEYSCKNMEVDRGIMAENLAYNATGSVCRGGSSTDSCAKYGRFYSWSQAMNQPGNYDNTLLDAKWRRQGICPDGWYVPEGNSIDTASYFLSFRPLPAGKLDAVGAPIASPYAAWFWRTREQSASYAWASRGNDTKSLWNYGDSVLKTEHLPLRCRYGLVDTMLATLTTSTGTVDGMDPSRWYYRPTNLLVLRLPDGPATATFSATPYNPEATVTLDGAPGPWTVRFDRDTTLLLKVSVGAGFQMSRVKIFLRPATVPEWNPNITYGTLYDTRDTKTYKTVVLNGKSWMAENLRYSAPQSMCPDSSLDSCLRYGNLYPWWTAMGLDSSWNFATWPASSPAQRGVCPTGWHVPSQAEWDAATRWMKTQLGPDSTQFLRSLHALTGYSDRQGVEDRFGFRFLLPNWGSISEGGIWFATNDRYQDQATNFGLSESFDVLSTTYSAISKRSPRFVRCRIND